MVTRTEIFKTSDGKKFDDYNLAASHEASLEHEAEIEAFLDQSFPRPVDGKKSGPARAIAKKAIASWIAHNEPPTQTSEAALEE